MHHLGYFRDGLQLSGPVLQWCRMYFCGSCSLLQLMSVTSRWRDGWCYISMPTLSPFVVCSNVDLNYQRPKLIAAQNVYLCEAPSDPGSDELRVTSP
jgi:hypothetical protein